MPIEIKELSFSYDSKPFIDNLDLKIDDGEMVGIIGNTGCGKSTFVLTATILPTKNLIKKFFAESLE